MGQKDISEKLLEDYEDVFADIVNILLFQGQKIVNPDTLSTMKVKSQCKANDSKLHESMFQSDFRIVAEYFTQIRKSNKYEPTEHEIQHVDEVLKLLSVFGEEEGIEKFLNAQRKKGTDKMAGVIDRMFEERSEKRAQEMAGKLAQTMAQEMAQKLAHDMAQDMAQNMAQNMAQEMAQKLAHDMAQKQIHALIAAFVKNGLSVEEVAKSMKVSVQQVNAWVKDADN